LEAIRLVGPVYEAYLEVSKDFDFEATASTYSFGWMYDGFSLKLELCPGAVAVLESFRENWLVMRVYAGPGSSCWEERVDFVEEAIGAWEDLSDYILLGRADPLVGGVIDAFPGLRLRETSLWNAFLIAVCQQNASFKQGWGMLYRLYRNASRRLIAPGIGVFLETPRPEKLSYSVLRGSGFGYRARTVMEAIRKRVYEKDCSEVDELRDVKGVGSYTLALVRLLACRDYSALPLDRWLRRLASEAYGVEEHMVASELRRRFGNFVGLAAWHTTIAFDAEPISRALKRLREGKNRPGLVEPSPMSLWRHTPSE
jgi:N-glycosylase/DNA lyase